LSLCALSKDVRVGQHGEPDAAKLSGKLLFVDELRSIR
jgi:hypothetical protein